MNVIIIAACIPTLRPLVLILFNRATPSDFLSHRRHSSYPQTEPTTTAAKSSRGSKAFDKYPITRDLTRTSTDSRKSLSSKTKERTSKNSILVEETICVETRELHSSDSERKGEEREWGGRGRGVPMGRIGEPSPRRERAVVVELDGEGVRGEDMV